MDNNERNDSDGSCDRDFSDDNKEIDDNKDSHDSNDRHDRDNRDYRDDFVYRLINYHLLGDTEDKITLAGIKTWQLDNDGSDHSYEQD